MSALFTLTAGQAITRAMRILGVLPSGGSPTNDQFQQGILALGAMLTSWQADGANLWRLTQLSLTVASGQGTPTNPVVVTPIITQLLEARWVVQGGTNLYERPMRIFTYADYMILPNKLSGTTSGPSIIMFDKQDTQSLFRLWPPPTNGGTLNCTVARSISTPQISSDPIDVPAEWLEAVVYNLADRLMDDNGVAAADPATAQRITQHALALYAKVLNFDRPASIFIRPWGKKGAGAFWRS